jgi:hypothetical protein
MKKFILSISTLALLLMSSTGCKKFVEGYDVSPNSPSDVSLEVLLTGTEVATISNYTGDFSRLSTVLVNQQAGRLFQYEDFGNYAITESAIDNDWQSLYNGGSGGAMINASLLSTKAGDSFKFYRGIGYILKALNLGLATDFWGDVPNSQALKGLEGEANFNPAYDAQADVFNDIQNTLDLAIADLKSDAAANIRVPSASDDLIFGGDVDKWRQAAYVLKARYYNRLSKRDASGSATKVLSTLDAAYADGLAGSGSDMMAVFGTAANEWNQWYSFNKSRAKYVQMNKFFLDILVGDPRLPLYATANASGGYDDQQKIGSYYGGIDASMPLVTFFEAKFLEAEAALRSGDAPRAATAYNAAVTENLTKLGVADAAYLAANAAETSATISLDKIMKQKYVAMFTQPEVFTDWRRTNLPALTPNTGANVATQEIPRRLPTPQSERLYNKGALNHIVSDVTQHLWFDN